MKEFDDKMKQALRAGERVEIGGEEINSVRSLVTEIFRFRNKMILAGSVLKIILSWMLAVVASVFTFLADDEQSRFLWAFVALFAMVGLSMLWQFHWMLLNRNAVLRELKRLELQIAQSSAES